MQQQPPPGGYPPPQAGGPGLGPMYPPQAVPPRSMGPNTPGERTWEPCKSTCDQECCMGFCCICIQVQRTLKEAAIPETRSPNWLLFNTAVIYILFAVAMFLYAFVWIIMLLFWAMNLIPLVNQRQVIADKFRLVPAGATCMDMICYCFCPGCMLSAEAITVRRCKRMFSVQTPVWGGGPGGPVTMGIPQAAGGPQQGQPAMTQKPYQGTAVQMQQYQDPAAQSSGQQGI